MEFNNKEVENILEYLIPCLENSELKLKKINKSDKKNLDKVFKSLLKDINDGFDYVQSKIDSECLVAKIKTISDVNHKLGASRYFTSSIKDYIYENGREFVVYSCNIHDKKVNIHFMLLSEEDQINIEKYDKYASLMYIWLYICTKYTLKECNKTLNIYLYLTPFKKELPDKVNIVLSEEHVNSAYTYACVENGEMVIFRQEEWFKIFIHESIHSFGFDAVLHNAQDVLNHIKSIFDIKSDYSICDAYTETLARVINSGIYCYNSLKNKKDTKTFCLYMNFLLNMERLYSMNQLNNILSFMNMNYTNLYGKTENDKYVRDNFYREKTHVFAYYILTSVLLGNFTDFCLWCNKDTNFYRFNPLESNKKEFLKLIDDNYKSDEFLKELEFVNKYKSNPKNSEKFNKAFLNSLRMSMVEY